MKYSKADQGSNPIQSSLYIIAYPISLFLKNINLKPNHVSFLSLLFTFLAFFFICNDAVTPFLTFWFISYILDYCDGTIARMTNNINTRALRLDHILDQIKILLLFLGFGIYYNEFKIWIFCFLSSTLYLFYSLLNHELSNALFKIKNDLNFKQKINSNSRSNIAENVFIIFIYKNVISPFIIVNGHTLLIFFLLPVSIQTCIYALSYFILVCAIHSVSRIRKLSILPR